MKHARRTSTWHACGLVAVVLMAVSGSGCSRRDAGEKGQAQRSGDGQGTAETWPRDGSKDRPLVVMLIPSETGSKSVLDDYKPLFDAVSRVHGIHFDLKMGDSYNAVIEGMVAEHIDIAFFGPVTFDEARRRGAATLLAVEQTDGASVYFAGIYHRTGSGMTSLADLRGKSLALGDPKSTSSFRYPVAMLVAAGIDPVADLGKIVMAGSHTAALEELEAGHVDAAAASLNAFDKSVESGAIDSQKIALLARSEAIPSPPLAMHSKLPADLQARLRNAFNTIHQADGVTAEMLLGYGGKKVDRYNAGVDVAIFDQAMQKLARVTDELASEIIDKAGQP